MSWLDDGHTLSHVRVMGEVDRGFVYMMVDGASLLDAGVLDKDLCRTGQSRMDLY